MPELDIRVRRRGHVTIFDLRGNLTIGEGAVVLRDAVREQIEKGVRNIVFNFQVVSYADSAGMGSLMASWTSLKRAGGKLVLLNVDGRIRDLLQVMRLLTEFENYQDEDEAVASFD